FSPTARQPKSRLRKPANPVQNDRATHEKLAVNRTRRMTSSQPSPFPDRTDSIWITATAVVARAKPKTKIRLSVPRRPPADIDAVIPDPFPSAPAGQVEERSTRGADVLRK